VFEGVVKSCASGSTAVVFHLAKNKRVESPVLVNSTGGYLTFSFDKKWDNIWAIGPAEVLFTGNFNLELISK
jgi:diaminopimelate epimerase